LERSEATLGVRELLRFEADRAWKLYEEGAQTAGADRSRQPGNTVVACAYIQRAAGANRVRGFCRVWGARAAFQTGEDDVDGQGAIRATYGREHPCKM